MTEISDITTQMSLQTFEQIQQTNSIRRQEARKSAAFEIEMQRLQQARSEKNEMRKEMDAIMSDIMSVLKKTGDEIRQSN